MDRKKALPALSRMAGAAAGAGWVGAAVGAGGDGTASDAETVETGGAVEVVEAVETVENEETQIPVHIARKFKPEINIGEFIVDPLPPIDFGRIAAQTAKQVIVQRVREYERKKQYDEFKDRVGEIIKENPGDAASIVRGWLVDG